MIINPPQRGVWQYGILCLVVLAPFFFWSYGFANHYASQLDAVPSIVYAWEKHIPLLPWTIVPYWSIDLFYGISLLLCFTKFELRQQFLRLLSAQLIAVSCFILFPLKFSFERPEISGFFGTWFDILMGFDKPFNQAPSLHIILLLILWDFFRRHIKPSWRWLVHLWSFLIGLSVLTTWQHHFIDIPTGFIVGAICMWLFPLDGYSPLRCGRQKLTAKHVKLASYYAVATIILSAIAFAFGGGFLWLLYPALSLALVALAYLLKQPSVFQKHSNGTMSIVSRLLLAPYLLMAWCNSRLWTRSHPEDNLIICVENVEIYLGRIPTAEHASAYDALFDCCAELPHAKRMDQSFEAFYSLDLIPIQAHQLDEAVQRFAHLFAEVQSLPTPSIPSQPSPLEPATFESSPLESADFTPAQDVKKLLIYCALGYSRSSTVLIAWLLQRGVVQSADQGMQLIQQARPWIVLKQDNLSQLEQWHQHGTAQ